MMKRTALFSLCLFVFAVRAAGADSLSFAQHLAQYRATTQQALAAETKPKARQYLEGCLQNVTRLDGLVPGHPDFARALSELGRRHQELDELLTPTDGVSSVTDRVEQENRAYATHLNPYVRAEYVNKAKLQAELLERKYFNTQTAKNANFVEGLINSRWQLTRADDTRIDDETLGVKPWEAIFRLEPAAALRGGPHAAIIGTLGLTYSHFPALDRTATPLSLVETPQSRWLRKTGLRLGAGAGRIDSKTRFLVGPGIQISALAIWGLYNPRDGDWMLGLGTSDLGKLKKIIGYFD